ncbi:proline racemase family protein [Alphaproteobacteria bacterium LSUCC0719]
MPHEIRIADIDVGGDYHRIILDGIPCPKGASAFEIRQHFLENHDQLRRLLLSFPFGTDEMCVDLLFPSSDETAEYGQIVMECMGYPYFSGSNTSATIAAMLEFGFIPKNEGTHRITHEMPSGLVGAEYSIRDGIIEDITIEGDDSYVMQDRISVALNGYGQVDCALVWSGAIFIMVDAGQFTIDIDANNLERMKSIGLELTEAFTTGFSYEHPILGRLDPPKFVNFMGPVQHDDGDSYSGCGAVYGHPGTIFRCPTGTGTAARMAFEITRGNMPANAVFHNRSATGTRFTGRALGWRNQNGTDMLRTTISSRPYLLSTSTLNVDFNNPTLGEFAGLQSLFTA